MGRYKLESAARRWLSAVTGVAATWLFAVPAAAQVPAPPAPADPGAVTPPAPAEPAPIGAPPAPEALPPPAPAQAPDPDTKALLEAQQKQIDELKARLDAAELAATEGVEEVDEEKLKIYGFTDFGLQRYFVSDEFGAFTESKTSFVLGNLNLYFDAQPVERWRTLFEVRFTNAPNGNLTISPTGAVTRTSTMQLDPHSTVFNATMWGGYTVIERAHTDYLASQYFNIRVGNFFTPIGIWNVDHGSPTLIASTPPQIIVQRSFPLRQTGLQLFGSAFAGPWELGYIATLTNGRQELSNFDYDDDKAFGGRLFLRNEGDVRTMIGTSFYYGNAEDKVASFGTDGTPTATTSWEFDEYVAGVDFSLDVGRTRIRTEAMMQRVKYETGKREPAFGTPGATMPDAYKFLGYALAAHQLPVLGLEPYLLVEGGRWPGGFFDTMAAFSGGLNVHFTPATQLKLQAVRVLFMNARDDERSAAAIDPEDFNTTILTSRLVVAF